MKMTAAEMLTEIHNSVSFGAFRRHIKVKLWEGSGYLTHVPELLVYRPGIGGDLLVIHPKYTGHKRQGKLEGH